MWFSVDCLPASQRKLPWWRRAAHDLGLSRPTTGSPYWACVEVVPAWTDMTTNHGAVRRRLLNSLDCDEKLALFVKPFVQLYEDDYYW
eukprot:8070715-Pyramimonas_sp.AAC.2